MSMSISISISISISTSISVCQSGSSLFPGHIVSSLSSRAMSSRLSSSSGELPPAAQEDTYVSMCFYNVGIQNSEVTAKGSAAKYERQSDGTDAKELRRYTPPSLASRVLELAYGTTSRASWDARPKLDADEVITSPTPTATFSVCCVTVAYEKTREQPGGRA